MPHSRLMSLAEATANVAVGYVVAVVTQLLVFPVFGLATTLKQNLAIGAIYPRFWLARSLPIRRVFEALRSEL